MAKLSLQDIKMQYFINGEPVPFHLKKGKDILIYPILVRDYPYYESAIDVLTVNKNEINNIDIIQMSYLQFVVECLFGVNDKYEKHLRKIIELCLHENNIYFAEDKNKICIAICDDDNTIKGVINSKEFEDIIEIILNQNNSNYDGRYISKDVREAYEEYCKLKYQNIDSPSLEKKKGFVISKTGQTLSEINNMIYRMFDIVYHSCVDSEIYIGQKIIQGSYKYKVDNDIMHPQFQKEVDPIASMFSDAQAFENKIQQING